MALLTVLVLILGSLGGQPPQAGAAQDLSPRISAAEKAIAAGDLEGGVRALEGIVAAAPQSFAARLALGRALDLAGRHADARTHLEEAVRLAPDDSRNEALTTIGISYAFESKPDEAARYYQRVFDAHMQADDRAAAAGIANALGRIYLESGNLDRAEQWYRTGHETAQQIPEQPAARLALWDMRWHNAMGRIQARRGRRDAAQEHAARVAVLLDKIGNDNQRPFYPYLLGYIAFYARDYPRAVQELLKGDLGDVFVLGLLAQAYERQGNREAAADCYRKVLASPSHSINAAFARPAARAFLAGKR